MNGVSKMIAVGGGFKDLLFLPLLGEMIHFDYYFQMGWNHQLVSALLVLELSNDTMASLLHCCSDGALSNLPGGATSNLRISQWKWRVGLWSKPSFFFVPRDLLLGSVCSDLLSTIMELESDEHGVLPKVVTLPNSNMEVRFWPFWT